MKSTPKPLKSKNDRVIRKGQPSRCFIWQSLCLHPCNLRLGNSCPRDHRQIGIVRIPTLTEVVINKKGTDFASYYKTMEKMANRQFDKLFESFQ